MLSGHNDRKLITKQVDTKVIPFYQVWQELVHTQTLDVYQYRVLTSLSALKELISVIEKTQQGLFTTDDNIEACRLETLYILKQDRVLSKNNKPLLNRLQNALGKRPASPAEKNRLIYHLKYAVGILGPTYLEAVLSELEASILNSNISDIEFYANIVASQAVHDGWSPSALFDMLRFFKQNKPFASQWVDFKNELLNTSLFAHDILINVPFAQLSGAQQVQALDTLGRLGLDLKTHAEIVAEYTNISDIGALIKAEKRYFRVSVNAKDIYSAAHTAISKLATVLNLASFYNLVDAWDLKSVVIVAINNVSSYHRSFTAESLYSTYNYLDSSGRVFESTRKIFADTDKSAIRDKLQGAFSYTNISRSSLFQEEKYMNLWVALESLSRTNMYSNIISNVKETVPAAICIRYVYRIVRNFVEDCKRCGISLNFGTVSIDTEQLTKQKMVKETIAIFQNATLYAQLLNKCSDNSLLKHRCGEVYRLITDVDFAFQKIENHYNRVNWQIQRLYRIRNEIAHAALQEQTSLIVYIEHLNDYLSTYISEIVTCISDKKLLSFEEALCSIKDNYDVFIALYKDNDKNTIKNDVLSTGIISLI
ncbi:MAG: hypothetical protein IJB02_03000 [Oscillospiraceae bacterium]|nr:hypothetical protein [Oscillospiraceae bacterium]